MTGSSGTVKGTLTRLTATKRAKNGRDYACALVSAHSKRQGCCFTWKCVVFGRSLEIARRLPLGSSIVARGEIYTQPATDPRHSMSMAVRDLVPFDQPAPRRTRSAPSPREAAESIFRPAAQACFEFES